MPRLRSLAAGRGPVLDREILVFAVGFNQVGIGLGVVPLVAIGLPGSAIELQDLRLNLSR